MLDKKYDLVSIGEIMVDMTQIGVNSQGNPLFAAYSGGSPANIAVAASRLGAKTAFIGRIGGDLLGQGLREVLQQNGVDDSAVSVDPTAPTTIAMVTVDEEGKRDYIYLRHSAADIQLSVSDLPDGMIEQAKILHFGSVSMTCEPTRSATLEAVARAQRSGALLSFAPRFKPALWENAESGIELIRSLIPRCEILRLSREEMVLFTGTANYAQGSAQLAEMGPFLVLVTLGEDGVFYRMGSLTGHVAAQKIVVSDTFGAGSTFMGAVLSKLSRMEDPHTIDQKALEEVLYFANTAAGITTSRPGAIPAMPTLEEVISY